MIAVILHADGYAEHKAWPLLSRLRILTSAPAGRCGIRTGTLRQNKSLVKGSLFVDSIIDGIIARFTGPLHFRFIVQPIIAVILAMRDGRLDAKAGTPPFVLSFIVCPSQRSRLFRNAFHAVLIPVIVGIIADAIAQFMIFHHVRPIPAILVGTGVIGLPYAVARGLTNRVLSARYRRKAD